MDVTAAQEIVAYVSTELPDFTPTREVLDLSVHIDVRGGAFDRDAAPNTLPIRAKTVTVSASDVGTSCNLCEFFFGDSRWTVQHLIVALDWGIGPSDEEFFKIFDVPLKMTEQVQHFIVIDIETEIDTCTCDSSVISLDDAERQTLGGRTAERYIQDVLNYYLSQLSSRNPAALLGTVPQWLFLYDFSGSSTINPANAPYVNQYDAGDPFDLPVRFGDAGGNACGPSSLAMALYQFPSVAVNIHDIYDQTMEFDTHDDPDHPGERGANFDPDKAKLWLASQRIPVRHMRKRQDDSWDKIEAELVKHRPVLLRTILSGRAYTTGRRDDGHFILLLGIGKNQDTKNALAQTEFGGNGDYYIVADPAGHYFANPDIGGWGRGHYGSVIGLATNTCVGIYLGGWFAVYPKSALQGKFTTRLTTLTPLASKSHLSVIAHSPVALLITAPDGKRTGIFPDGTVLEEIPNSEYQTDEAFEEESGIIATYPDGPKSVVVDEPAAGVYRVDLVGTGTGPYVLDWFYSGPDGVLADKQTQTGNATPGSGATYYFTVPASDGAPLLSILLTSTNTVAVSWPTSSTNFVLQQNTSLSAMTWTTSTEIPRIANGSYLVVVPISASGRFFRLAKLESGSPPSIVEQPANQASIVGNNVTFSVAAIGTAPLSYQWRFNGSDISGATSNRYTLIGVHSNNAGAYEVVVTNGYGSVTSQVAALTVLVPPTVTVHPQSQTVTNGANVTFTASAIGTAPLSYQWRKNGINLAGAMLTNLGLSNVQPNNAGNYAVVVTNVAGSVTSAVAVLTVMPAGVAPSITEQPMSQTVLAGSDVTFSVVAAGTTPLSYQWLFNGGNIPGAASNRYALIDAQTNNMGVYFVVVTNGFGSITSQMATLTVLVPPTATTLPAGALSATGATLNGAVNPNGTATGAYFRYGLSASYGSFSPTNNVGSGNGFLPISNVITGLLPNTTYHFQIVAFNSAGAHSGDDLSFITPPLAVSATWTTMASSFGGGRYPLAPLVQGRDGNFYGTTSRGGTYDVGTKFTLTTNGSVFANSFDSFGGSWGSYPEAGLLLASNGFLYGTAPSGGANTYYGTAFKLHPSGGLAFAWAFNTGTSGDGSQPYASLIQARDGYMYGTTGLGGAYSAGTIFKMTAEGTRTRLFSFRRGAGEGSNPRAALIQASDGNFYGTTELGGDLSRDALGFGTVFKLTTNGTVTTLFSFNGTNGSRSQAALVQASNGDLYGTTSEGGDLSLNSGRGHGTVFKITANGTFTTLVVFNGTNGSHAHGTLVQATDGNLYGTTFEGGANNRGTVFRVMPDGAFATLISFNGTNGSVPYAGLIQASDGNLYGTTQTGGANGHGTVFRIDLPPSSTE